MSTVNRRAFLGVSIGGLAALGSGGTALAALQCTAAPPPSRLAVDCSVGRNLQLFLKNESLFGLTGVVSMTTVQSVVGNFAGGTLFVYPWLKSQNQGKALAAQLQQHQAFLPGPIPANPLPNMGVPLDEQFCTYGLQAPTQDFIGFSIDVSTTSWSPKLPSLTVVKNFGNNAVGIDWASSNLNSRWFGGSQIIPTGDACNGQRWRTLIVDGLRQASTMTC